jgi:hypothetical protein
MTIYYRGPEVLITDQVFVARWPAPRTFVIDELDDVHVVVLAMRWFGPRRHELRARHRSVAVLLFASYDPRTFGQVRRGLMRAVECQRERREEYGELGYR